LAQFFRLIEYYYEFSVFLSFSFSDGVINQYLMAGFAVLICCGVVCGYSGVHWWFLESAF
jgi:hypothetical protein